MTRVLLAWSPGHRRLSQHHCRIPDLDRFRYRLHYQHQHQYQHRCRYRILNRCWSRRRRYP